MATSSGSASDGVDKQQQLLAASWFDSAWIPSLSTHNVMEYFSQRSNPFYDRTCNNEILRMQRGDPAQLVTMQGTEYSLLHVQEPILYVIRKAHRQSPTKVTPLADFYILDGVVYQCPDLQSVINSRLFSALDLVNSAFSEVISYARYDPSKGYHWEFPDDIKTDGEVHKKLPSEEPSLAQRKRVDVLLSELVKKFPPKAFSSKEGGRPMIYGAEKLPDKGRAVGEGKEGVKRPSHLDTKLPDVKRKRT